MNERYAWLRVVGGGCFVNVAVTGLLVGMFTSAGPLTDATFLVTFLLGATVSFGLSLLLLRQFAGDLPVMRKVMLAALGVLLGSLGAVFLIAGYLLLSGL